MTATGISTAGRFVLVAVCLLLSAGPVRGASLAAELLSESDRIAARREALRDIDRHADNAAAHTVLEAASRPAERTSRGLGERLVGFYRTQISPAIGSRCSLEPSCSEYFLQGLRCHGWLALPLLADRLVREPGVVARGSRPIERNGHIRYSDPLCDHDAWLPAKRRTHCQ